MTRPRRARILGLIAAAVLAGCMTAPKPPVPVSPPSALPVTFTAARFAELPGWADSDVRKSLEAFRRSCGDLQGKAADSPLGGIGYAGTVADWGAACREAAALPSADSQSARAFFEAAFVPYRLSDATPDGLFTGYFEPELRGSRNRHGPYQTPLYGLPPDLVTAPMGGGMMLALMMRFDPYPARAQIVRDGIAAPPLFYVDDPIDAFFLQVQGSGRIVLDDGTVVRAAYAGQNGWPYTPIGAVLLERGELTREEISLQSIRGWLQTHPDEAEAVMDTNESYVFFSEQPIGDPTLGALGAEGVPLTPGASLAVDRSVHALGVPVWLQGSAPDADPRQPDRAFNSLLVMQDTGGAIKGVVRGDVYWGYGADAQSIAGRMKHPGRLTVLLPRGLAGRLGPRAQFPVPR
jgi:membrane-bound lytic murein transglycosylase A